MIKRILLLLAFMISTSMALEVTTYHKYVNGAIDVMVKYKDGDIGDRSKDWIAVYKKGSSTEWKNVITWSWLSALPSDQPYPAAGHLFEDAHIVEPGEYVIRLFRHNSYNIEKSVDFTIKKVKSFVSDLTVGRTQVFINGLDRDKFISNEKDWIGIYKEEDNNAWGNVIEWRWARTAPQDWVNLNKKLYQDGVKYQARYFLNNSFITHKETKHFYMGNLPGSEKNFITYLGIIEIDAKTTVSVHVPSSSIKSSKDWVGLFKDDVKDEKLTNLIAWVYVNKAEFNYDLKIIKPELINRNDTYKAVFFSNDSYTQVGKKVTKKVRVLR
jgi:hypothetical protein